MFAFFENDIKFILTFTWTLWSQDWLQVLQLKKCNKPNVFQNFCGAETASFTN